MTGKAGVAPGALPCRLPEGGADLKQAECCTGRVLVWTGAKWEGAGQFRSGPESRYVGTPLRVGRSSGVGEAQAIGGDGEVAIIARLTAYLG